MAKLGDPTTDPEIAGIKPVNSAENRELYKAAEKIYPKRVSGFFRRFKWIVMALTLGVYYLFPWLRWDRGPYAPDQAVLVDLVNRRFYFFFIEIWPQEFFFVAGLLVMAGVGLFLVTSVAGRAWCGYTCPQTVWVDLFLLVERFIEGDRNKRIKLDKAAWSAEKFFKKFWKHVIWIAIAVATGGAWVFYFADAPTLAAGLLTGDAPYAAYATIAVLTITTYLLGGIAREQVCTYMCPWPRVQAAMLDEDSLIVTYNDWRGEPRGKHRKKKKTDSDVKPLGDCVDCNACVAVCPMGIDIREGLQLECITCALCIDACDGVMQKLGLEEGLISYSTLRNYNANMELAGASSRLVNGQMEYDHGKIDPTRIRDSAGKLISGLAHANWLTFLRPRTILYTGIYAAIGLTMLFVLLTRDRLSINLAHDRNPLYVELTSGAIQNGYELKIRNMKNEPRRFRVTIDGLGPVTTKIATSGAVQGQTFYQDVRADETHKVRLYVMMRPEQIVAEHVSFQIIVSEVGGRERATKVTAFEAPKKAVKWEQ